LAGRKKQKRRCKTMQKKRYCCKASAGAPQQLRQPDEFVHLGRRQRCSAALGRAQGSEFSGALGTRTRLPPVVKQLEKR
jgi:hypothetical protein